MFDPIAPIREKSQFIANILLRQRERHKRRELGGSYDEACGLAKLQHERALLQARLAPLRLVEG